MSRHRVLLSLGSNTNAEQHIPQALESIRLALLVLGESAIAQTEPVDFPYPSDLFTNVLILAETTLSKQELIDFLHALEQKAGRDRTTPECVTLDADLISWDSEILKARDLQRPYFSVLSRDLPLN